MSHMSALGFAMTVEAFQDLVESALDETVCFSTPIGSYHRWSPGAGVELWLQANAVKHVVGCNPHFEGQGRLDAAIIETVCAPGRPLDGHCFGWAAPREPSNPYSGLHAFAASLPDFAHVDERILVPPVVTLQVAAFATQVEYFPTEAAYVTSEWGQYYGAVPGSTTWLQADEDGLPQPDVFLTGHVAASERIANPATGQEFHTVVLRTDAGTIDVVADLETAPRRPVVGAVVAGTFWLSARAVSKLPPPRRQATFQRAKQSS